MSSRFLMSVFMVAVLMSGCQVPGEKLSGADEGYFTWVDETGQVRQSRIPTKQKPSEESVEEISSPAHDEFNLENYPDGNALAERGFIRPGDPEPYFTWRDALGNVRVSYYQPETREAVEEGEIERPLKLSKASIYQSTGNPADIRLPESADAAAAAVLGFDGTEAPFLQRWTAACCSGLDRSDYVEWQRGREFGVDITEDSPEHEFTTGTSHYQLVKLPPALDGWNAPENPDQRIEDFILRLRSFDQKGLLVPSVAFLDSDFRTLRLVTDLVADYTPESWYRHGHLKFHIPVFPSRGERWILIYTTDEARRGQTVIETRYGPRAIKHTSTGELGLARVVD